MVVNREDCCSDRLSNYDIRVGDSGWIWDNPKCNSEPLSGSGVFSCDLKGQFLGITLNGENYMHICEVKAWEGSNIAIGKSAV
jgi:hypothetical protein